MLRRSLSLLKCQSIINNHLNNYRKYSTLQEINLKMAQTLDLGAVNALGSKDTLKQILQLAQELRQSGEALNSETFEHMLSAYAKAGINDKVLLFQTQMLANGIKPSFKFYQKALKILGKTGDSISQAKLLEQMDHFGYKKTSKIYFYLLNCMRENLELERALDTLESMKRQNIQPSAHSYLVLMDMAICLREPLIAFQLLKDAEKLDDFENVAPIIYMDLLRVTAYAGEYKIVSDIWNKTVNKHNIKPDEGLCLYILNIAGKHNDVKLATEVIKIIGESGYPYRECHFIPLIEAFSSTGNFKSIFQIFAAMRKVGVIPDKKTALPIAYKLGKDKSAIHQAKQALESIAASKEEHVDVVAFNLVIHSLAYNKEYDEALALYNRTTELGVEPNDETLDAALDVCIHCRDAELGKSIYEELINSGITETASNLSKMVTLMCTQEDYEDAFIYLERMKQLDLVPLRGCYFKLVKTLSRNDDSRLNLALDDMRAYGYSISTHMTQYMENDERRRLIAENSEETRKPISIM